MKARKLLELYRQGQRDFSQQNLQGLSFRGQDLSGANFTGANIQGTDFTEANLQGADFSFAKAGLPPLGALGLLLLTLALSILLGLAAGWVDALVELDFHSEQGFFGIISANIDIDAKWVVLLILLGFGIIALQAGMIAGLTTLILALVVAGVSAFTATVLVPWAAVIVMAIAVAVFVAVVAAMVVTLALTTAYALNLTMGALVIGVFTPAFTIIAVPTAGESAVALAIAITLVSAYVGWGAYWGDDRHRILRLIAEGFSTLGGTSFRGANLTHADFTHARLKSTSFNDAILHHTHLKESVGTGYA
ncbi:MAG: pentapeptide repeat-containing protein [Oculatellaceae cyanobacterium Prado106]|jgi:hypothetical protein|nr:pentapeptide repeat-containing protein [Oculatellaceae cyanobacterium Prado106]